MARRLTYTVPREPIELELGGQLYHAPPILPAAALSRLIAQQDELTNTAARMGDDGALDVLLKVIADIFELMLIPESAAEFRERLFGTDNPFDLYNEVMPAITGLIEEYTGRPTQPSSPSTPGLNDGGQISTDGAPAEVSTPSTFPPTATAT